MLGHLLRGIIFGRFPRFSGLMCSDILPHENVLLQLCGVHPVACSSLALSRDSRFLLTAADRAIKVWDYLTLSDPSCQVCAAGGRRWVQTG